VTGRRAHGARPRMSAALRNAMDLVREDAAETYPRDRLVSCGVDPGDAHVLIEELYTYFGESDRQGHPLRLAMQNVTASGREGRDEDALPLLDAIVALPQGQRATFLAMIDLACAFAAAEGFAVGALYLAGEVHGRAERRRSRPKR
jgi:hypothetical protein